MTERQRSILVVDDEAAQRHLLGSFLQSLGFCVTEAASAEEALAAIRHAAPDMVLLDVRLPGMSGIEALGEIRRIAADLPVLLITAFADLRQAVAAMKSGADDYLSKPIDLDEFLTVSYYADAGSFSSARASDQPSNPFSGKPSGSEPVDLSTRWAAPAPAGAGNADPGASGPVHFWFVVTDGRGGVRWETATANQE